MPLSKTGADGQRYDGSTLVTSNLPFDEWRCSVPPRLTGALSDRLTHHVHILEMGDSYISTRAEKT